MRKFEAVIFDMDGVLVNSEPWHYEIECDLFKRLGLDVPEEVHLTYIGTAGDHMYTDLKSRYDIPMTLSELIDWDSEIRIEIFKQMKGIIPNPGLVNLLEGLKASGIKLAVATSSVPGIVRIILEKCSIDSYFESIVTTEEAGKSKPAPDVFLMAANNLGVLPENCAVFEDSFNGIKAAKDAGMFCIAYQPHNEMQQDISKADKIIESFDDINTRLIHRYFEEYQVH